MPVIFDHDLPMGKPLHLLKNHIFLAVDECDFGEHVRLLGDERWRSKSGGNGIHVGEMKCRSFSRYAAMN
jgi:hypothetical protein